MAFIDKKENYMGLPMNIKRGNPIPLDDSSVWYSYDEMATYAQTGKTAYVGQILSLVDESTDSATAYIILNEAGELLEVGSATLGDNKTITLDSGVLGLKDFGSKYYAYVEESTNEETGETIAAHYVEQEVDAEHPWKAGLEPKVVSEDGQFVLGWYEPNPTTIEGVNAQVTGIQTTVNDLTKKTQDLDKEIDAVVEEIGVPSQNKEGVVTPATGLYAELEKKVTQEQVNTSIAEAIADAGHLKREVAESVEALEAKVTEEGADQYIYMVANGDVYDEYMIINGKVEKIGDTKVDISGKVDKKEGYDLVSNEDIAKLQAIEAGAEKNIIQSVDGTAFGITNRQLTLNDIPVSKVTDLQTLLDGKVSAEDGKQLMTAVESAKLADIEEGAQKNFITAVSSEFKVGEGNLQVNAIDISKITNLQDILDGKVSQEEGKGLSTNDYSDEDKAQVALISGLQASIGNLDTLLNGSKEGDETVIVGLTETVRNLQTVVGNIDLSQYVLQTDFNTAVGEINDAIADIEQDITDLDQRMQWGTIEG
jgi:hypothetical protein